MHHATVVGITTPHCIGMKLPEVFSALDAIMVGSKNKRFWIKNSIKPWVTVMSQHHHSTAQGFVYLWVDRVHHMFYLGSHKGMPTDNYAHSSSRMPKFSMHSVPQGYHRIILAQGNYLDMMLRENRLLQARYRNPLYHNICATFPGVMHADKWTKLKQSKKMKQRWGDPLCRQKLREQMKFAWTAVRKQQLSERIKRLCAAPEFYKKRCKAMKRISNDPTIKFKASERMKNRYANPIERLKQSKIMISIWSNCTYKLKRIEQMKRDSNTPERKKKLSENKKRYYSDPANRLKQSEIVKKAWQKRKLAKVSTVSTEGAVL